LVSFLSGEWNAFFYGQAHVLAIVSVKAYAASDPDSIEAESYLRAALPSAIHRDFGK